MGYTQDILTGVLKKSSVKAAKAGGVAGWHRESFKK